MSETVTVTISKSIGYSGKSGGKAYIAKIVGTSEQYIFDREFIDTECVDKNEMFRIRRKRKGSWTEAAALEPGLYERKSCDGKAGFSVVWIKDGEAKRFTITEDRAIAMACMMDDGDSFEAARIATKPATVTPAAPEAPEAQ